MPRMSAAQATILVVDDNEDVLEVVGALLQSEGYGVATASNGAEALEHLRAGLKPALVVLDLTMPVMDGWEFRDRQLRDPELRDIPTIIYSAIGRHDAIAGMHAVGAFEKGADFDPMLRLIADICRRP
jgi:CheY-like chemotaxis protein